LRLDEPVAAYLPDLPFGGPAAAVTVRMLLNQTSGIGDYDGVIFRIPADVERVRTTTYRPRELARLGLAAPRTGAPGERWSYSNTNYVIAGLLIERVTGRPAEFEITRRIMWPLGLWRTYFPATVPYLIGPNAHGYVPWTDGDLRDFTTYNMSWAWTAGALVSTSHDINRFLAALLGGRLLRPAELEQMRRTVPFDPAVPAAGGYGLGLMRFPIGCGDVWGHDGIVWGYTTNAFHRADGSRQITLGMTISHYQTDPTTPHPIDMAIGRFASLALCGQPATARQPAPLDRPGMAVGVGVRR
jgi:D-alanyl-D-alanine carboxypeptidase